MSILAEHAQFFGELFHVIHKVYYTKFTWKRITLFYFIEISTACVSENSYEIEFDRR